jgi:hypothetical protein
MKLKLGENIFETKDEFKQALEMTLFPEFIEKTFEHESAHYNKAQELGYQPYFNLIITGTEPKFHWDCLVGTREIISNPAHKIEICLAPKNPSEHDRMIAEEYSCR